MASEDKMMGMTIKEQLEILENAFNLSPENDAQNPRDVNNHDNENQGEPEVDPKVQEPQEACEQLGQEGAAPASARGRMARI